MNRVPLLIIVWTALVSSSVGSDTVRALKEANYGRVVVVPRATSVVDGEVRFGGPAGPHERKAASILYAELASALPGRVVPPSRLSGVLRDITAKDLTGTAAFKNVRRATGADALVTLNIDDLGEEFSYSTEVYDLKDLESDAGQPKDNPVHVSVDIEDKSLSDAAYQGESFEVRRWSAGHLEPLGLDYMPNNQAFGHGLEYEKDQYLKLLPQEIHPLKSPGFPYGISIVSNGKEIEPVQIGKKLFVELNKGKSFRIRLENKTDRRLMMGVWVDGVNVYGKNREHPIETPATRIWSMKPKFLSEIAGWYEARSANASNESKKTIVSEFLIEDAGSSVAARTGVTDQVGMLTVIIYSNGFEGIPSAPTQLASKGNSRYGVGSGTESEQQISFARAQKGLMLAAVTLHLRSSEELTSLLNAPSKPRRPQINNPGDLEPGDGGKDNKLVEEPAESETGESVSFSGNAAPKN